MTREDIVSYLEQDNPSGDWEDIVLFDDIDSAFVGTANRCGMDVVAVYDYDKCIEIYREQGMGYIEALENANRGLLGTWAGDKTPLFLRFRENIYQ